MYTLVQKLIWSLAFADNLVLHPSLWFQKNKKKPTEKQQQQQNNHDKSHKAKTACAN